MCGGVGECVFFLRKIRASCVIYSKGLNVVRTFPKQIGYIALSSLVGCLRSFLCSIHFVWPFNSKLLHLQGVWENTVSLQAEGLAVKEDMLDIIQRTGPYWSGCVCVSNNHPFFYSPHTLSTIILSSLCNNKHAYPHTHTHTYLLRRQAPPHRRKKQFPTGPIRGLFTPGD